MVPPTELWVDHMGWVHRDPSQNSGWSAAPVRADSSQAERPATNASKAGSSQADKEYQPGGTCLVSQRSPWTG